MQDIYHEQGFKAEIKKEKNDPNQWNISFFSEHFHSEFGLFFSFSKKRINSYSAFNVSVYFL